MKTNIVTIPRSQICIGDIWTLFGARHRVESVVVEEEGPSARVLHTLQACSAEDARRTHLRWVTGCRRDEADRILVRVERTE